MDVTGISDSDRIDPLNNEQETSSCTPPSQPPAYFMCSELDNSYAQLVPIPEGEPLTTFTPETITENSDTKSYDSNTPLIGAEIDTNHEGIESPLDDRQVHTSTVEELNNEHTNHANIPIITYPAKSPSECVFSSLNQIMLEMPELGIEEIIPGGDDFVPTPLRIIGSGWEFGSICSIPLQSMDVSSVGGIGCRSRSNTLERKTYIGSQASIFPENRLLSRVIMRSLAGSKMSIGSKLSRNFDKDVYTSITDVQIQPELRKELETPPVTRNMKNLIVLSVAVMMLHCALFGLRNLQSSLNSEGGLGVISLALSYGMFMFGSLISQFLVLRFTPTKGIVFACIGNMIYVLSNIYPSYATIAPSSAILGFANAIMWTSLCTYITEIGINESRQTGQRSDSIQSKFFGILFVSIQFAMVLGNLLSSLILLQANNDEPLDKNVTMIEGNGTVDNVYYNVSTSLQMDNGLKTTGCGSGLCPGSEAVGTTEHVDKHTKIALLSTYFGFATVATLLCQLFVDPLPDAVPVSASVGDVKRQAGRILKMTVDPQFIFCVILCIYTSSGNGFVIADILQAYVTCPQGIYLVGYAMICFGLCGSVSSYLFGKITPIIGRTATFVIAGAINVTSLGFMFTWETRPEDTIYILALLGAWGFSDGIWQSQINSLISTVFAERYETAFGCCRVLQGFGGIVVFIMSDMVCMQTKILFCGGTCILSIIGYVVMEIRSKRDTAKDVTTMVLEKEGNTSIK